MLQDAGIEVLPNTSNQVQENIEEDTAPNNEKLFEELMQVIENGQADTEDE